MATDVRALRGVNMIMLMRPLSLQSKEDAGRLAFQTTHDVSSSRAADTTQTKDGNIVSLGAEEVSISLSSIMAQKDETREKLKAAYSNPDGEIVEFWKIDKTVPMPTGDTNAGKFPATYYQGYITEWSESAPADGAIEMSLTAEINGSGVEGFATLTEDQKIVVQYKFVDTTAQESMEQG